MIFWIFVTQRWCRHITLRLNNIDEYYFQLLLHIRPDESLRDAFRPRHIHYLINIGNYWLGIFAGWLFMSLLAFTEYIWILDIYCYIFLRHYYIFSHTFVYEMSFRVTPAYIFQRYIVFPLSKDIYFSSEVILLSWDSQMSIFSHCHATPLRHDIITISGLNILYLCHASRRDDIFRYTYLERWRMRERVITCLLITLFSKDEVFTAAIIRCIFILVFTHHQNRGDIYFHFRHDVITPRADVFLSY